MGKNSFKNTTGARFYSTYIKNPTVFSLLQNQNHKTKRYFY